MTPRRWLTALPLLAVIACSGNAIAEPFAPGRLAAGFHGTDAPLGVRWWYSDKAAIDLNVGFSSSPVSGRRLQTYVAQLGFPFVVGHWGRLAAEIRPGIGFKHADVNNFFTVGTDRLLEGSVELEAEAFLLERLSVSGSFGLAVTHNDPELSGDSVTSWGTTGGNFSHVGFHLYFGRNAAQ
jgi:hypothetical protein